MDLVIGVNIYEVYTHVYTMLTKYRNIKCQPILSEEAALSLIDKHEFIQITGQRDASDPRGPSKTTAFVLKPSPEAIATGDFKRIIKQVQSDITDIIIITQAELQAHVQKKITEYHNANPGKEIEVCRFIHFKCELPLCSAVAKHEICPAEDLADLDRMFIDTDKLPKISRADGPIVWLGVKRGTIIKIWRYSECAGHTIAYRIVI